MDAIFDYMEKYDYGNLFFCRDKALNFKAIIAIHDTTLGTLSAMQACCKRVFEIADRDQIPTYLAADRMAEERIRQIAEVKKYVDDLKP